MAWCSRVYKNLKDLGPAYRRISSASSQTGGLMQRGFQSHQYNTVKSDLFSHCEQYFSERGSNLTKPFTDLKYRAAARLFSTEANCKVHEENNEQKEMISVTFVDKDGEEKTIKVPIGMSMLEAAHENDIELEGACEGSLACSTCHVIVMDVDQYNKLEEPTDEENDMLDLAFGLTETSRLGCQIIARPELDGIRLALPAATRNFAVDGHVPKPH